MTLRLILTRHAKSDWDDPALDDHDRPLNARGQASAQAMGAWLLDKGYDPEAALVSTARRAVETWEGMALSATSASFHRELYHAPPETILSCVAKATAATVLVIGHNPGFAILADALVSSPPLDDTFRAYPTCATLVADFDVADWWAVRPGQGRVVDFAVPRAVMGGD